MSTEDLFENILPEFHHEISVTTFTCDSSGITLAAPAGQRFEVYQITMANVSGTARDAGFRVE